MAFKTKQSNAAVTSNETAKERPNNEHLPILPQLSSPLQSSPSAEVRQKMIGEAAYYLAEQRGFAPGYELDDWLAAEKLIDQG